MKITIEERQMIFKFRLEVTNVKMNCKGMYENLKCEACNEENETQEHLIKCKILNKNEKQAVEYNKIKHGNVRDMTEIAKKFMKVLDIRAKQ